MSNTGEGIGWRKLARAIIIQSVRDLGRIGIGEPQPFQRESVLRFVSSSSFDDVCEMGDWEPEWVRDVFVSVDKLSDSVRAEVTRETVIMMVALP